MSNSLVDSATGVTSSQLFGRASRFTPGGVNSPVRAFRSVNGEPFFVHQAEGCHIFDVEGRRLVDLVGTWGPAILGHAPSVVIEAVTEAALKGLSFGIPNPLEVEMAALICEWVPSIEKVRLVNSGTEATMSAIRLARGYTGRDVIVKFDGCYHGHVDSLLVSAGSGAMTHGRPDSAGVPHDLARLTVAIPFNDFHALERVFIERSKEIAAVIVEPVPANVGLIPPEAGFLESLRELTTKHDSLLIFDEVMTGFRVARGGVQELFGITPDLTALGKVMGGGLPVGAFGGRADIMDQLAPDGSVYQAGTLSGNPVAMAAGLAQLRELEARNAWAELEEIGAAMEAGLSGILAGQSPCRIHRLGSMFSLFFTNRSVKNLEDAKSCDRDAFSQFFWRALQAGVYFPPSPFETSFLSLAHTPAVVEETIRALSKFPTRATRRRSNDK